MSAAAIFLSSVTLRFPATSPELLTCFLGAHSAFDGPPYQVLLCTFSRALRNPPLRQRSGSRIPHQVQQSNASRLDIFSSKTLSQPSVRSASRFASRCWSFLDTLA